MIKKSLLAAAILLSANTLNAEKLEKHNIVSLSYYASAPGATLSGYKLDDTSVFSVKLGQINKWTKIGWFIDVAASGGANGTVYAKYSQFGFGANYSVSDKLVAYAGLGSSTLVGGYEDSYGNSYETIESKDESYITLGASYNVGKSYFVDVSLQTVAGFGFGFGKKF